MINRMFRSKTSRGIAIFSFLAFGVFVAHSHIDGDLNEDIEKLHAAHALGADTNQNVFNDLEANYQNFTDSESSLCDAAKNDECFMEYAENADEIKARIKLNSKALEQYMEMIFRGDKRYVEPVDDGIFDWHGAHKQLHELFLAKLATEWVVIKDNQTFVNAIESDINFWRNILSKQKGLVTRMHAIGSIERDLSTLQQSQSQCNGCLTQYIGNDDAYRDITSVEKSMRPELEREFLYMDDILKNITHDEESLFGEESVLLTAISDYFFTRNKNRNLFYESYMRLWEAADDTELSVEEMAGKIREISSEFEDIYSVKMLDNPVGRILLGVAVPSYDEYVEKLYGVREKLTSIKRERY